MSENDEVSLYGNEHEPPPGEFVATGVIGILLYMGMFVLALFSFIFKSEEVGQKKHFLKYFYISLMLLGILEEPRYFAMAIDKAYKSRAGYACHILSNFFYFCCLAAVVRRFASILELGSYMRLLYSTNGLLVAIVLQGIVDIIAFASCLASKDLGNFFSSPVYFFFTIFDIIQNVTYTVFLSFYGIKLIYRFNNLERSESVSELKLAFHRVVVKVAMVLSVTTIFTFLRLIILIIKLVSLHDNGVTVTAPNLPLYGFGWFLMSDLLPRGVSAILLALLMMSNTKAVDKENNKMLENSNSGNDIEIVAMRRNSIDHDYVVGVRGSDESESSPRTESTKSPIQT